MTHEELLARIDEEGEFLVQYFDSKPIVHSALRAVVELHKPKLWLGIEMVCEGCGTDIEQNYNSGYPCPTIQAIEKELV